MDRIMGRRMIQGCDTMASYAPVSSTTSATARPRCDSIRVTAAGSNPGYSCMRNGDAIPPLTAVPPRYNNEKATPSGVAQRVNAIYRCLLRCDDDP